MALQSVDRRQFLALMASVSSLPLLYACGSPRLEGDYFDMLRETRQRIRTSPDYVSARLDQLAEAGDIDGLLEYMRRHFAVLPPDRRSWASVQAGRRWGSRGVMRARAGTPREIADLLVEVAKKADMDARLVLMPRSDDRRDFLINAQPPEFAPRPGPDDIQAWSGAQPSPDLAPANMELAERITRSTIAALDMQKFRPRQHFAAATVA